MLDKKERKNRIIGRDFIVINGTPHYPVTFRSLPHLMQFAELDDSIEHPLGIVYKTKIAHSDNRVRIVVLNAPKLEYEPHGAFIFDRVKWGSIKNPFTPEYHEPERRMIRGVSGFFVKRIESVNNFRSKAISVMPNILHSLFKIK